MVSNVTRGGLQPAKIINLTTNDEVKCMFNPFEYTLSKQNSWEKKPVKGKNVPQVSFKQGGSQTLKLTLQFDTLLDSSDVRKHTDKLWQMMLVDDTKKNPQSDKSQPPEVAFEWDRLYFKAVLTNMTQKFTLFDPKGTPVRCTVDITLEQLIDIDDYGPQSGGSSASPGTPAAPPVTATEGDRIDNLAAAASNLIPESYRPLAALNKIDNPLRIRPGQILNKLI